MDQFPHHIRPVLRGGDYYLARYFCEGLAVVVRGDGRGDIQAEVWVCA